MLRDDWLEIRPSDYTASELDLLRSELAAQPWSTGHEAIDGRRMPSAFLFPPGPTRRALLYDQYENVGLDDFTEDERAESERHAAAVLAVFAEMRSAGSVD